MRLGLVARAENRGLGIMSWEFARHLDPKVLIVDIGDRAGFPAFFDRYPDATRARYRSGLNERVVRHWLAGVDVVYHAETFYDPAFPRWAHDAGVASILHVMPEFFRGAEPFVRYWAPTTWRLDHLPPATEVVPVPVALDRWPSPVDLHEKPCRWLHVAGKATLADRNGTGTVLAAAQHLRRPCSLTIVCQDATVAIPATPRHVDVRVVSGATDYWALYTDHDALVMPRRYGGLSLPVQEAMGAGLAVLMSDCSPNPHTWPAALVATTEGPPERMPAGAVPVHTIDPEHLARAMDTLADPAIRHHWQRAARGWARAHSWGVWADRYRALLTAGAVFV